MQVKLSAIEIKVEFPPLQETFEQDFSLLMNDFSNLFRRKESMARNQADDNWSRKFQYDPLIKVMLRSILHWTKFSDNITNLFLNKKNGTNVFHSHYDGVSGGRQIWMDINQVRTKSLVLKTVKKIVTALMLSFLLARRICPLKSHVHFWNRLTFLNNDSNTLQRF